MTEHGDGEKHYWHQFSPHVKQVYLNKSNDK